MVNNRGSSLPIVQRKGSVYLLIDNPLGNSTPFSGTINSECDCKLLNKLISISGFGHGPVFSTP